MENFAEMQEVNVGRPGPEILKEGSDVALIKREIKDGRSSGVGVGDGLTGVLSRDANVGSSVILGGGQTSPISSIEESDMDGRVTFDTDTSTYEVLDKKFKGLEMHTEIGDVHLPIDSQPAKLDDNVINFPFGEDRVYINKPELKDVLLETHGAQVFRAVDNRFMVLAKVGKVHMPFYISSHGTGGKNSGEWYPFFGYTGDWIVKGSGVAEDGKMNYSPIIDEVREKLNKNLVLPKSISPNGKMGYEPDAKLEPRVTLFDLSNHLKYKSTKEGSTTEEEVEFVREMTGYDPKRVHYGSATAAPWIDSIVSKVK